MARRKKKRNNIKSVINLVILIVLLIVIGFLIQKFVIPLLQKGDLMQEPAKRIEEEEKDKEEYKEIKEVEVNLYFADENAQYLIPESRKIVQTENLAKQTISELIKGPGSETLFPTIPETTRVKALYISDGIAYIDFSSEIIKDHPGGSAGELLTVYSIVMTLTSFPEIEKVQILVEGNSGDTLVGHMDISTPLERDEGWLKR